MTISRGAGSTLHARGRVRGGIALLVATAACTVQALTTQSANASGGEPGAVNAGKATATTSAVAAYEKLRAVAATKSQGCTGFSSQATPPNTIRVLHEADDTISVVPFRDYVKNVVPNEWIPSWHTESLRTAAMAVKTYAWWWADHSSANRNNSGQCFDVGDTVNYQVYKPGTNYPATDAAVDDTWSVVAHMNGSVFDAEYRAYLVQTQEACGAGTAQQPGKLSQWGSQACAADGETYRQILSLYYPGVDLVSSSPVVARGGSQVSVTRPGGRRDLFAVDLTGHLEQRIYANGAWGSWADLGGSLSSSPVVTFHDNRLDVFAIGTDGSVQQRSQTGTGGWTPSVRIADQARYGIAVAYHGGRYDLFTMSTTGELIQYINTSSTWGPVIHLGGIYTSGPSVTYHDGRYDVFASDTASGGRQKTFLNGRWSTPKKIGGVLRHGPSASYHDGRYDIFCVGTSGSIFQMILAPGWSPSWFRLRGFATSVPAVDYTSTGVYTLIGLSADQRVQRMTWSSTVRRWTDWADLGSGYQQP